MIAAQELPRLESQPVLFVNDHSHAMNERKSWVGQTNYAFWNLLYQRLIARQVTRVIVPNQACYDCLKQRYSIPSDRLQIIPLGYDAQQFCRQPSQKNQSHKLVIGFAGKIQPAKRVEVLLEAIHRSTHAQSIECHIVGETGDAYSQELRAMAARWQLDVHFQPLLKTEQLAEFYNFLDVAVYPGSISITTQEATGCGTPILLYESIPGLEDRVMHGRGYLFRDTSELTARIDEFVVRKKEHGIDHAAIEQASRAWSWEHVARQYLSEYEMALSQRRGTQ